MCFLCRGVFVMQHRYMRRLDLILFCFLVLWAITASAGTYVLTDGTKIEGDPIFPVTDGGVVFRTDAGEDLPRTPWDKITQESIRVLLAKATTAHDKALLEPLIEELPQEKAQLREIIVKPIEPPDRPTTHLGIMAIFGSPVGLVILMVLYGANLFAAYEVAIYRHRPLGTVCGLAAIPFFGVFSPIAFIAMPTWRGPIASQMHEEEPQTRFRATPPPAATTPSLPVEDAGAASGAHPSAPVEIAVTQQPQESLAQEEAPALPEPIVFRRGDFSFNRRFFETKLAGFFRLVPSEADKDMVVHIKSGRGDFTGRRISRITPNELYLQIFHDNATADEMIPFVEILEVQIRNKNIT